MEAFSFDIYYLCQKVSDMSGLPVRIYREDVQEKIYCNILFPKDPVSLYLKDLFEVEGHAFSFTGEDGQFYGALHYDALRIIVGPSFRGELNDQQIHDLAFRLSVPDRCLRAISVKARMPSS